MRRTRPGRRGREDGGPNLPGFGVGMAAIWLVFLFNPIVDAWHREGFARYAGIALSVVFAGVYLWHWQASSRFSWGRDLPPNRRQRRGLMIRYLLLVAISLACTLVVGQSAVTTWVFVAVSGLWTFRFAIGLSLALSVAAGYFLAARTVPGWQPDASGSVSILLATVAVAGGMLAARRGRALSEAKQENALLVVQEERNRVARDVHDILGHTLTVIRVKAELAAALIDVDPVRAKTEVLALEELSREALADVRRAVEGFREISLAGELARARIAFTAAGITATLPGTIDTVPSDLRELFAWTVREGVTNVVRHSRATACQITFRPNGVVITDDGQGATPAQLDAGLVGLRERAKAAGATVITRALDPGLELTVQVASTVPADSPPTPADTPQTENASESPLTGGRLTR